MVLRLDVVNGVLHLVQGFRILAAQQKQAPRCTSMRAHHADMYAKGYRHFRGNSLRRPPYRTSRGQQTKGTLSPASLSLAAGPFQALGTSTKHAA